MTDQYRISDQTLPPQHRPPQTAAKRSSTGADTTLWIVLITGAAANAGISLAGYDLVASLFGSVAAVAGIALLVRHLKRRK